MKQINILIINAVCIIYRTFLLPLELKLLSLRIIFNLCIIIHSRFFQNSFIQLDEFDKNNSEKVGFEPQTY